jgi:hypothetical protein
MMFPRTRASIIHYRYYLRTWEYLRRNLYRAMGTPIYPTIVQIGTQNRCNGRCRMCPYPDTVALQPRAEMSAELVSRTLDEMARWNVSNRRAGIVVFTLQNEPLLDSRVPDFVAEARRKLSPRWEIEITTNGVLLCGGMAERIAAAEPAVLNVSVNGFSQATYDATMPGFSVATVSANIEAFLKIKSARTELIIRYVKQRSNDSEFLALKRYWTARGVAVIGYGCNDRLGDVRDYESMRSRATTAFGEFIRKVIGGRVFSVCPFLFCQANILPSGKVLMCCHDYRHEAILGALEEPVAAIGGAVESGTTTLAGIFNSEAVAHLRREAHAGRYSGICLRCSLFKSHVWL